VHAAADYVSLSFSPARSDSSDSQAISSIAAKCVSKANASVYPSKSGKILRKKTT
jgi:hypothetical protein